RREQGLHALEKRLLCEGAAEFALRGFRRIDQTQDFERGMCLAQLRADGISLRTVRDQEVDCAFVYLSERKRLRGVGSLEQVIPVGLEEIVQLGSDAFAVTHQQNRRRPSRGPRQKRGAAPAWEKQLETEAAVSARLGGDVAAVLGHDAVNHRERQALIARRGGFEELFRIRLLPAMSKGQE